MSPQNMPPWHKDYFELKIIKKQQTANGETERGLCHPPICLKTDIIFLL